MAGGVTRCSEVSPNPNPPPDPQRCGDAGVPVGPRSSGARWDSEEGSVRALGQGFGGAGAGTPPRGAGVGSIPPGMFAAPCPRGQPRPLGGAARPGTGTVLGGAALRPPAAPPLCPKPGERCGAEPPRTRASRQSSEGGSGVGMRHGAGPITQGFGAKMRSGARQGPGRAGTGADVLPGSVGSCLRPLPSCLVTHTPPSAPFPARGSRGCGGRSRSPCRALGEASCSVSPRSRLESLGEPLSLGDGWHSPTAAPCSPGDARNPQPRAGVCRAPSPSGLQGRSPSVCSGSSWAWGWPC